MAKIEISLLELINKNKNLNKVELSTFLSKFTYKRVNGIKEFNYPKNCSTRSLKDGSITGAMFIDGGTRHFDELIAVREEQEVKNLKETIKK